ncbi:Uncharacterised protein [Acinetobacter junii]|uniref:hypothetical protein n=1 Tax=Acinetobacter TaxID=469 RepID=UPI001958CDED|nr:MULTISPECIES: hypothetical protein [Acinetobacter]MDA3500717.1 hypothetical protein [Acinetobacter sp. AOR34_HL]VTX53574.1 Uncharacterised protein [Acinetobacter junii]
MSKIFLTFSFSLFLVGCATPVYNSTMTVSNISKPPINTINTVSVGDQMLVQGTLRQNDVLELQQQTKISLYTIPAGQFIKTGENEKGKYFTLVSTTGAMVQKAFMADPAQALMTAPDGKLCVITVFNLKACQADKSFVIKKTNIASENSFQQTLIYSGKVGNKINIGYREFSSNMARPAFNNDVEYDLNESKQIGYKGALLEIIEANNQNITYKVLKNFNKVD